MLPQSVLGSCVNALHHLRRRLRLSNGYHIMLLLQETETHTWTCFTWPVGFIHLLLVLRVVLLLLRLFTAFSAVNTKEETFDLISTSICVASEGVLCRQTAAS